MKNIINVVLIAAFISTFAFNARADRWSAETMKSGAAKRAVADGSMDPSAEDAKQGAVKSAYRACEGVMLYEPLKAKKRSDAAPANQQTYWEKRKASCDVAVSNCALKVQTMAAGASAIPFLETVRQTAVTKLSAGITQFENVKKTCFDSNSGGENCAGIVSSIKARVAKVMPEIRLSVAMLGTPSDKDIEKLKTTGDYSVLINKNLSESLAGFVQSGQMEPLTSAEYRKVQETYERLIAKARAELVAENEALLEPLKVKGRETDLEIQRKKLNSPEALTLKIKTALAAHRAEVMSRYSAALEKAPEAIYIGSGNASKEVMAAGLGKMIADQQKRLTEMKEEISAGTKPDLSYAGYSAIVNQLVEADMAKSGSTAMCGPATQAYTQLKDRELRNGLLMTGGIIAGTIATGGAGSVLFGTGLATTMAVTGAIVGTGLLAHEYAVVSDARLDARTGLTTHEDAQKATETFAVSALTSPLNFIGTGAVTAQAFKGAKSMVASRFGAAAVAKGVVKSTEASADEVARLAATATVQPGTTASKEAIAAAAKLEEIGNKAAAQMLGHDVTPANAKAFEALADGGFLGTKEAPLTEVASKYAAIEKQLTPAQKEELAADLKRISDVVQSSAGKKGAVVHSDPATAREAGLAALELASSGASAAQMSAAAKIFKAGSGWGADALRGFREVLESAKALAKGTKEVVGDRFKQAYAKLYKKATGKEPTPKELQVSCDCTGLCARGVGAVSSTAKELVADTKASSRAPASLGASIAAVAGMTSQAAEPIYMACVNPEN